MKLVVEFLIIFKTHFSLKRCSSLLKGRKAVLGNWFFVGMPIGKPSRAPLNQAIYLLHSGQFWDEDKQWGGQMADDAAYQQRYSWAEAHPSPETHQTIRTWNLVTNRCDLNISWSEVGQCCSESSQIPLSREEWSSGPSVEPLLGKQDVNFLQIVQASSSCQTQLKVLQGDSFQCCHYQRPTSLMLKLGDDEQATKSEKGLDGPVLRD